MGALFIVAEREVDYRVVELLPELIRDPQRYVQGNAAPTPYVRKNPA